MVLAVLLALLGSLIALGILVVFIAFESFIPAGIIFLIFQLLPISMDINFFTIWLACGLVDFLFSVFKD